MTQKDSVLNYLKDKEFDNIKNISEALDILEPNIRRILGIGEKKGEFERISRGIYKIKVDDQEILSLYHADALEKLPELVEENLKVDLIFLDIPYVTKATRGGNRGVKYDLINLNQFEIMLSNCTRLLRNEDSKIVFMFSNAKSGLSEMNAYLDLFSKFGYSLIAEGKYQKLFKNGMPVRNMTGAVSEPEGINVYSRNDNKLDCSLDYEMIRINKGYQTEKNKEMIIDVLEKLTKEKDVVLDPCAGSGVVGISCLLKNRIAILIEKSEKGINYICDRISDEFNKTYLLSFNIN